MQITHLLSENKYLVDKKNIIMGILLSPVKLINDIKKEGIRTQNS